MQLLLTMMIVRFKSCNRFFTFFPSSDRLETLHLYVYTSLLNSNVLSSRLPPESHPPRTTFMLILPISENPIDFELCLGTSALHGPNN